MSDAAPPIELTCAISGLGFSVTPGEQRILAALEIPLPTLSPLERHRRRLAHRNEDCLYSRECDFSGKRMISVYSADSPFTVYSQEVWWSDVWDPTSTGLAFDPGRPFFEQFQQLQRTTPRLGLANGRAENSEYCHNTLQLKDCYLVFGGDYAENCLYSYYNDDSRDLVDVYRVKKSELCYDCVDCTNCYNVRYSQHSYHCRDSAFLFDCLSCSNCIGCVGLRHAAYCIFNQQYSPEDYAQRVAEFALSSWSGVTALEAQYSEFLAGIPRRAAFLVNTEDCTGNRIVEGKQCVDCFDIGGPAEDLKDVISCGSGTKSAVCSNNLGKIELAYEVMSGMEGQRCAFALYSWSSSDAFYCDTVVGCTDVFGCSSLRNAKNCILNRSYSVHEYQQLRKQIVEHMRETCEWGEFFPVSLSPFAYNETLANQHFPLSETEVRSRGWRWVAETSGTSQQTYSPPDALSSVTDEVLQQTFTCEVSGKPFKILAPELSFYRKMQVPLPRLHFSERTRRRVAKRGGLQTVARVCGDCGSGVLSAFSQELAAVVLCQRCVDARAQ